MITQRSHLTAQVHKANRCQHGWKVKGRSLPRPDPTHGPRSLLPPRGGWVWTGLLSRLLLPRWTLLRVISTLFCCSSASKSAQTGCHSLCSCTRRAWLTHSCGVGSLSCCNRQVHRYGCAAAVHRAPGACPVCSLQLYRIFSCVGTINLEKEMATCSSVLA